MAIKNGKRISQHKIYMVFSQETYSLGDLDSHHSDFSQVKCCILMIEVENGETLQEFL